MSLKNNKNIAKITIIILLISLASPLIGFKVNAADNPQQQWIKIYDGTRTDKAYAITTDSFNNVIVTGVSEINSNNTCYTIKYDANGDKILAIISDTLLESKAYDVTVDSQNNIIIVGTIYDNSDNYDYIIIKYDSDGNEIWNKTYDGGSKDIAYGVAVDSSDNIIVTGESSKNYYTIKYNENGGEIWNNTYGNSYNSSAKSIAVDLYDNIIVTGYVFTANSRNWYTIKYAPDGTELWNRTYGNGDHNTANAIATDFDNNIIVVGTTYLNSNSNVYILKYDENGGEIWNQTYNHSVCEYANDVAINSANDIIVAGSCCKTLQKMNYALIKYDYTGNHMWSVFYDRATQDDFGAGTAVDSLNNVIITGFSENNFNQYDYLTIKYSDQFISDIEKPVISNVNDFPDPQEQSGFVNISCNVTDNVGVDVVKVNITDPNGDAVNVTMNKGSYYYNTTYDTLGTYYYFIWANDTSDNKQISDTYSFIIQENTPPYQPTNPSPSNGATGVNINVDLSWDGGDPDPSDDVTYDIYFGTSNPPPKVVDNQINTFYDPGVLIIDTMYYWKVIAHDDNGHSTEGPVWNFITGKPNFVWVDDDYNDSTPGWGYDHFDSIQDGINAVVETGTVYVFDGIYYENILIDKEILLIGSGITTTTWLTVDLGWAVTINASNVSISNMIISGNDTAEGGIKTNENGAYNNIRINDTIVQNFTNFGIKMGNDILYSQNQYLYDLFVRGIADETVNGSGIYFTHINNSRIRDSVVNNISLAAIYLNSAYSCTVSNNTLSNSLAGIAVEHSKNNTLTKNRITNTNYGIVLWNNSHFNRVANNRILDTTTGVETEQGIMSVGIEIMDANNNTVDNNYISNTTAAGENAMAVGIFIMSYDINADNNIISNNQIYNTTATGTDAAGSGIFIRDTNYNTLTDNNVGSNDLGIHFWLSSYNTVFNNTIKGNSWFGIHLYFSSDNIIYNNNFNNTNNAWDNGNNTWDIRETLGINIIGGPYLGGNYWNDYTGVDTDDPPDGLGNTMLPYNCSGNIQYGGDLRPLTYISDEIPPEIIDNTSNIGFTGDSFTFNATVTDDIFLSNVYVECWYGTGSHTNVSMNNVAGDFWEKTIVIDDTLETLHYTINAKDWTSNWNTTSVKDVAIYDNDKPQISEVHDDPDPQEPDGYVNISCNVTDNVGVDVVKVNITDPNGNAVNVTMNKGSYYYNTTYNIIGTYYYFIWANDTSDNKQISDTYSFTIRTNDPPDKPINPSPSNDATGVGISPALSVDVSDSDGDIMDVYFHNAFDDSLIGIDSGVPDGGTASVTWSGLSYSTVYSWYTIAKDYSLENSSNVWSFTTKDFSSGGNGGNGGSNGGFPQGNLLPTSDASAGEPYIGFVDEEITFNGSLSYDPDNDGYISSWYWDFGDGTNGTGETITHVYSNAGTYTIILTVTDNEGGKDNYETTAFIGLPNRPPSTPIVEGATDGSKNIEYIYTAVSIDPDNDTIMYVFDWGDETITETDYFENASVSTTNHTWLSAGIYAMKVYAKDVNNATSGIAGFKVMIDTKYVHGIGYLIDNEGDGTYDVFFSNDTGAETVVEKLDDGKYLLDSDGDGDWDYVYDPDPDTLEKYSQDEEVEEADSAIWYILGILLFVILLILLFAANRKKKAKKKGKKKGKSKVKAKNRKI